MLKFGIFAETDNVENLDEDSAAIEEITVEEVEEKCTPEEKSHVNPTDDCKIEKHMKILLKNLRPLKSSLSLWLPKETMKTALILLHLA